MSQSELLRDVTQVLAKAGVPYMVTGSVVSSSQGQPRSTHDIDLVVQMTVAAVPQLASAFPPPRYFLDDVAMRDAISRGDMFNLLDNDTGDKVDFWILKKEPFDLECFARRVPWELAGVAAYVSRPEDTILQKLRWAELCGGSEKQFNDAKAVYELQYTKLDIARMNSWAATLEVTALWERLQREAQPIK